jgi:hypothetical protein
LGWKETVRRESLGTVNSKGSKSIACKYVRFIRRLEKSYVFPGIGLQHGCQMLDYRSSTRLHVQSNLVILFVAMPG